jgi:hypothetical protein
LAYRCENFPVLLGEIAHIFRVQLHLDSCSLKNHRVCVETSHTINYRGCRGLFLPWAVMIGHPCQFDARTRLLNDVVLSMNEALGVYIHAEA